MNYRIVHKARYRIRFACRSTGFTLEECSRIVGGFDDIPGIRKVKVYEYTGSVVVYHDGTAEAAVKERLAELDPDAGGELPESHRNLATSHTYKRRLWKLFIYHCVKKFLLPSFINKGVILFNSVRYLVRGLKCLLKGRLEVPVLDAAAISAAVLTNDFSTAGSVMFLLNLGEILEEWTHKKTIDDLAASLSLNIDQVWVYRDGQEIQVPIATVEKGDHLIIRAGYMIPIDGEVVSGEAMVNQASLTGESLAVRRIEGHTVFAGTVLEEGELIVRVRDFAGQSRIDKIMSLIDSAQKVKSKSESKAEHLADALVPYSFLGAAATMLLSGSISKAISVLMVDFSCALKLAMPISILSAMREASEQGILVKGGKFVEAVAEADTIIFDKTGTLTKAEPRVAGVVPFYGRDRDQMLTLAACLEEHFPHSIANAVVNQAKLEGLAHEEMHSKVEYIVAHGIASYVEDQRVLIGSAHFIFEDEQIPCYSDQQEIIDGLSAKYSLLHMSIAGELAAVICIDDPLRPEAAGVVRSLRRLGVKKLVMLTGDNERTAGNIAGLLDLDDYRSEVLPEDKAAYIEAEKAKGKTVIMIGDGINDSPALSLADAGIAMSDGADVAKEIADITILGSDLGQLAVLRKLSEELMKRIKFNYRFIVSFNAALIGLGLAGIIAPGTSAALHNASTIAIGGKSMTKLLKEKTE